MNLLSWSSSVCYSEPQELTFDNDVKNNETIVNDGTRDRYLFTKRTKIWNILPIFSKLMCLDVFGVHNELRNIQH